MTQEADDARFTVTMEDGRIEARTLTVGGETTALRLEASYWRALEDVCRREGMSVEELVGDIRGHLQSRKYTRVDAHALSAATRVFIVGYFRQAATETGHERAGHGGGDSFSPVRAEAPT